MSLLKRFFGVTEDDHLTPGAKAFLSGKSNTLTSADVDPAGAADFARYEKAMKHKAGGQLREAAALLEKSCSPPSIYKGHYRELFKVWRQMNRDALAAKDFRPVVQRVQAMIRYDEEMTELLVSHWGAVQRKTLPSHYFDGDRNLLQADLKALVKAADALGMLPVAEDAERRLQAFKRS